MKTEFQFRLGSSRERSSAIKQSSSTPLHRKRVAGCLTVALWAVSLLFSAIAHPALAQRDFNKCENEKDGNNAHYSCARKKNQICS
jgi:hypothetical protein